MTPEQLRLSILQYAIQGKLVEQRPEEGTGEELYQQILTEKQRLISGRKIRKERILPEITESEIPFDIPDSWKWVRVQYVTCINPKVKLPDSLKVSSVPMALIDGGYCSNHSYEIVTWGSLNDRFTHFADGDIGIAKINPDFQNRKSVIFRNLKNGYGAGSNRLSIVRVIGELLSREYLLWFFKSAYFIDNGIKSFRGVGEDQKIHKDYLAMCLLPLPPLKEQQRIVAKIEELMPLVDRYADFYGRLNKLNAKFSEDMKKSIFYYAMQGKLVEQRPEDGTGEELYRQIKAEKRRLIVKKKVRGRCQLPTISEDEIPFDIPKSWKWVRLNEIASIEGGYNFKSTDYTDDGVRVIRISDFNETGFVDFDIVRHPFDSEFERYVIELKNILICMSGATIGKSLFVTDIPEKMMCNQRVGIIKAIGVIPEYINYFILSPLTQKKIPESNKSVRTNISIGLIKNLLIPLPPLAEQKRIVAKIEKILQLCEQVK